MEDRSGNVWFTAISKNYIGKLDPKTGEVTEYPAQRAWRPRAAHADLRRSKGTLFFTLQSGHVGRLVPATGVMTIVKTPSENTYPYGIQVNSKGVPWYVDFRGNRVGQRRSGDDEDHRIHACRTRRRGRAASRSPRTMWSGTRISRGAISGRFDPRTGAVKEWPSPSGASSQPYGIATEKDIVWYSESAVTPNTLVRFDPKTEAFQSWAIPSGGGVVRNMMRTAGRQPRAGVQRRQPRGPRRDQVRAGRGEVAVDAISR